jgi:hypothetical protein
MRLTTPVLRDWIKPQVSTITGLSRVYVTEGRVTDMPDRQISLMRVGAIRVLYEGAFEEVNFRFEYRGKSNSLEDAENIAISMDSFLWGRNNFEIDDVWVTSISYGSGLRQLPSSDNNSRYSFTADYKFLASREG